MGLAVRVGGVSGVETGDRRLKIIEQYIPIQIVSMSQAIEKSEVERAYAYNDTLCLRHECRTP